MLFITISNPAFSKANFITLDTLKEFPGIAQVESILVKSYARLGYRVYFSDLTPGRAAVQADKGELDGLIIRADQILSKTKNLIKIPIALLEGNLMLYCLPEIDCDLSVLENSENVIGAVSGLNISNEVLSDKRASSYQVKTHAALQDMLAKKRLKYILTIEVDGLGLLHNFPDNFQKIFVKRLAGYHAVHKNLSDIVPALTSSIQLTINELQQDQTQQ
ncbi:hypothetical protein [Colwellia sp. MEBiC06753]